jgi:sulfite reductase beta subunit-like hemoprotein
MRHTCQWRVADEQTGREVPCGKPAVAHITWLGSKPYTYYYCALHYDKRLKEIGGRKDVLEASGVR